MNWTIFWTMGNVLNHGPTTLVISVLFIYLSVPSTFSCKEFGWGYRREATRSRVTQFRRFGTAYVILGDMWEVM